MKLLAWKICCNAIATQHNLHRRGMDTSALCQLCGMCDEDTFHVFICCPHARNLWHAMREVWDLPGDDLLKHTGREWLLQLLHEIPLNQRARTLMVIWRIWHCHNEMTHDKPCPPIESSRRFLVSYLNSLLLIKQWPDAEIEKGKMVVDDDRGFQKRMIERPKVRKKWVPPAEGNAKLNVDGAFDKEGAAGIGAALRDHRGNIILAACRSIDHCRDATKAELMAIEEGLKLSLTWTTKQFCVETDCSEALDLVKESTPNTSIYAFRINVIRDLLRERGSTLLKISRDGNCVSHELARLGRLKHQTQVWLESFLSEISAAVTADCNSLYV
jgi:hypothetical protein